MKTNRLTVTEYLASLKNSEKNSNFTEEQFMTMPYLNLDEISEMGAGSTSMGACKPYVMTVSNSQFGVLTTLNAVLFGFNDYFNQTNFGSDTGISITPASSTPYRRVLAQTQNKSYEVGVWRITSTNTSQLAQVIMINYIDANGRACSDPVPLPIYKDAYQQDNTIVDIFTYPFKIDGNTYLTFPVLANTDVTFIFFPKAIADPSKLLLNKNSGITKKFKSPTLSNIPDTVQTIKILRAA